MAFLFFDRQKGELYVDPEIKGRKPYTLKATSGRDECMNDPSKEGVKKLGPIPAGIYFAKSSEVDNPGRLKDVFRNFLGDWGDWRVPLSPHQELNNLLFNTVTNRDGFFLHGGSLPGSAGCIDVGGKVFGNKDTDQLLEDLKADPDGTNLIFIR